MKYYLVRCRLTLNKTLVIATIEQPSEAIQAYTIKDVLNQNQYKPFLQLERNDTIHTLCFDEPLLESEDYEEVMERGMLEIL